VHRELLRTATDVGRRLRERGFQARTAGIKIRFTDFRTITRVRTLSEPTDSTAQLHRVAVELFDSLGPDFAPVRLVGVKAENLIEAGSLPQQLTLDLNGEPPPGASDESAQARADSRRQAEAVLDAAREKFGPAGLKYAALLRSGPDSDPTRNVRT
jgi:DNA polymerase-4